MLVWRVNTALKLKKITKILSFVKISKLFIEKINMNVYNY